MLKGGGGRGMSRVVLALAAWLDVWFVASISEDGGVIFEVAADEV